MQKLSIGNINDYTEDFQELKSFLVEDEDYKDDEDDALACFLIGWIYENGKGTSQNYNLAKEWYLKASKQKFAEAHINLGLIYEVEQDYMRAEKFYKKATKNIKVEKYLSVEKSRFKAKAYYRLGSLYEKRKDNNASLQTAMEWYYKSANQGYAEAQYKLGKIYQIMCEKFKELDILSGIYSLSSMAKKCYMATNQENAEALYEIGRMNIRGLIIPDYPNSGVAHIYFRKSAELGFVKAQKTLEALYGARSLDTGIYHIDISIFSYMWKMIAEVNGAEEDRPLVAPYYRDFLKAKIMAKRCLESDYKECGDGGQHFPTTLKKLASFERIFETLEYHQVSIAELLESIDE